jgi:hypothetical protein
MDQHALTGTMETPMTAATVLSRARGNRGHDGILCSATAGSDYRRADLGDVGVECGEQLAMVS